MRRLLPALLLLAVLAPSAWLAWRFRDMPQFGLHHDDALYWVGAQSLSHGSYRIESLPGAPFQTKYPPAYSLLLSVAAPDNLHLALLLNWLMLPLMVILAWQLFERYGFPAWQKILLCAWMATAPMTMVLSTTFMSELLFTSLLLAVFLTTERPFLSGILAAAAILTRSVALPLLLAVPLAMILQGRTRQIWRFVTPMLAAMIGWQIWVRQHASTGTDLVTLYYTNYLGFHLKHVHLSNLPRLLWVNLDGFLTGTGRLLWPNLSDDPVSIQLARLVTIGCILGTIRLARRTRQWAYPVYAAGLCGMLLLWHYPPSPRFVYPMFPILVAGFLTEATHVFGMAKQNWLKARGWERAAVAVICGILAVFAVSLAWFQYDGDALLIPDIYRERGMFAGYDETAYQWIRTHTPAPAKFLAYDDVLLYLHTGRQAVNRPTPPDLQFTADNEGIRRHLEATPEFLKKEGIDYVLITDSDYFRDLHSDAIVPLRRSLEGSGEFTLAAEGKGFRIYSRKGR